MRDSDSCRFCIILTNNDLNKKEHNNPLPIYDTILYETTNFIVVPALGALVSGYLMIVSRNHMHSMACITRSEMDELNDLIEFLREKILRCFNVSPILFEHGSALGCVNKSACCIEHAHLHLVPVHLSEETRILQYANAVKIPNLQSLISFNGEPYLLYVNAERGHYLSRDTILPSQYMRKWIANEIGRPFEWDWRLFEFIENINTTVELFKDILRSNIQVYKKI
jgi:diadenosine tetraphosphate (Ap4A) HIT family hydrolase